MSSHIAKIVTDPLSSHDFFAKKTDFVRLKSFGEDGHTVDIAHQLTLLLGPNGSGKTQFLRGINGMTIKQRVISNDTPPSNRLFRFFDKQGQELNKEFVIFDESTWKYTRKTTNPYEAFPENYQFQEPEEIEIGKPSTAMSAGQFTHSKNIQTLDQAQDTDSSIVLFDEPTVYVDDVNIAAFTDKLLHALQSKTQIFMASHDYLFIESLYQRYCQIQEDGNFGVIQFADKETPVTTTDWLQYTQQSTNELLNILVKSRK